MERERKTFCDINLLKEFMDMDKSALQRRLETILWTEIRNKNNQETIKRKQRNL